MYTYSREFKHKTLVGEKIKSFIWANLQEARTAESVDEGEGLVNYAKREKNMLRGGHYGGLIC